MTSKAALLPVLLLAAAVRLPFWREALRTPVDGDTAILGLMALHPWRSLAMWGQPYGSPLEAWIAAPVFALFGATPDVLRCVYFGLSLALVAAAFALGRALSLRLAVPVALLAAVPPPYFLLLSALPPPMYPSALALSLALLAWAVGRPPRTLGACAGWGALAGLSLWTHLMTASLVLPAALWIVRYAAPRLRHRAALALLLPLLALLAPWWGRAVVDRQAASVIGVSGRRASTREHLAATVPALHRPVLGVFGGHTPLVADDPVHVAPAPRLLAAALALAWTSGAVLAAGAVRADRRIALLAAAAALTLLAFPFPLRSGPSTLRFLTPMVLPLAAAALAGTARRWGPRAALVAAGGLTALNAVAAWPLLAAWRAADRERPPFLLPDLGPVRRLMEARGLTRAYASYGPAYRLTFESGERIIASQPWNERFLHHPLPYLDEVRFAKDVAWVLTPDVPTDLPAPRAFEEQLSRAGGTFRRESAGAATVYDRFAPPFGSAVVPATGGPGAISDGDPATALRPFPERPLLVDLGTPRVLSAVTLIAPGDGPRLPRSFDVEASADGAAFDVVASRRRRGEREDLRWVNGHPQYVIDHDVLAVPLGGRTVRALRLVPVASADEWGIAEVLLHPAGAGGTWEEWLDPRLGWAERRQALSDGPRPERADWWARRILAGRAH